MKPSDEELVGAIDGRGKARHLVHNPLGNFIVNLPTCKGRFRRIGSAIGSRTPRIRGSIAWSRRGDYGRLVV